MKILHVNTTDYGGAGNACKRIHLGLLAAGIDSKLLVYHKATNTPNTYGFFQHLSKQSIWKRLYKKVVKTLAYNPNKKNKIVKHPDVEMFSFPTSKFDITEHPLYEEADIVQLNWVSGFLDEPSFFKKNTKPVVWRMADLYACGGGNHYEKNFPFDLYKDFIRENKQIRIKNLLNKNITFVAISNWVLEKANNSDVIGAYSKKIIHNGLDFNVFKSHNTIFARDVFNLPHEKKIILLGADYIENKRKGFKLAIDAIKKINELNVEIVIFGKLNVLPAEACIYLGDIGDEKLLSILYSAADYFLISSIEEAFGQMTIESLACGTPVISFPTGGSVDVIIDGMNGVLAKDFTSNELAEAIKRALTLTFNKQFIINDVKKRFHIKDKVLQYVDLYNQLIEGNICT